MLLTHLADSADLGDEGALGIADVEAFYRAANQRDKDDPEFHERARQAVVALQSGEPAARARWAELVEQTKRTNRPVYELLGIRGLVDRGESFYQPLLEAVVDDLAHQGLLVDDQGAKVVFVDGFTNREGDPLPLIIQNRHGGFGYAVTDLAALRHRLTEIGADRVVYVVDAGQSQHLEMVFAVARAAGWVPAGAEVAHVGFGLVLGEDGKRLRTRSGENVSLRDLLAEAVDRSRDFVLARAEERAEPPPDDLDGVARAIGVGAVKYADLSQNRQSNYVFSFDRMLSLKGNTAPYLQYAHARIRSILRTAASGPDAGAGDGAGGVALGDPSERELAKLLVGTADVVARVAEDYEPNHLCGHLFEVAQAFSRFYEACPVLKAEDRLRRSRLALCGATADVLRDGLALLGIEVVERLWRAGVPMVKSRAATSRVGTASVWASSCRPPSPGSRAVPVGFHQRRKSFWPSWWWSWPSPPSVVVWRGSGRGRLRRAGVRSLPHPPVPLAQHRQPGRCRDDRPAPHRRGRGRLAGLQRRRRASPVRLNGLPR